MKEIDEEDSTEEIFTETLLANPAEKTFEDNVENGLTIFCPSDDAMKGSLPKLKNLTASGKQSLLEYHGMPIYQSLPGLKSSNGLTNTLATDGASKFNFYVQNDGTDVTIETKIVMAKILNTLVCVDLGLCGSITISPLVFIAIMQ